MLNRLSWQRFHNVPENLSANPADVRGGNTVRLCPRSLQPGASGELCAHPTLAQPGDGALGEKRI